MHVCVCAHKHIKGCWKKVSRMDEACVVVVAAVQKGKKINFKRLTFEDEKGM